MAGRNGGTPIEQSKISRIAQGVRWALSGQSISDWFGPGQPIAPQAQEQAYGRQYDYAPGYNISTQPRAGEPVTFAQLRGLADSHDILRLAIETRKDQMAKLVGVVKPKDGSDPTPRCKEIMKFLERPDQEHDWDDWLRMWLEEVFVTDAAAILPRMTKGGQLYALEHIDGATIKRVLDEGGRTPVAPDPAYQQVLKGIPAVDYSRDELFYIPRNQRVSRVYGYGPVEQIIMTVNIALLRSVTQLSYYTEGNIPPMLAAVPTTWNTDQIEKFQKYWDVIMSGDLAKKQQIKFVPGDLKTQMLKPEPLFDQADEWLARVVLYAMNLPPNAFVKQQNRATAGSAQEIALEEGLAPIMQYVKRKMTRVIEIYFKEPDLEFAWEDTTDIDPLIQAQIDKIYVDAGIDTPDEIREGRGLAKLPDGLGAKPKMPVTPMTDPGEDPEGDGPAGPPGKPKSKKGNPDGVTAAAAEKAVRDAELEKFYQRVADLIAKTDGSLEAIVSRMSELELPAPGPDTRIRDFAELVEHGVPANKAAKHVGLAIDEIEGGDVSMVKATLIPLAIANDTTTPLEPIEKSATPEPAPVIIPAPNVEIHQGDQYFTIESAKGGKRTISMTKPNGEKVNADITEE
jgi:Phage portal protein